ncbi:DUF3500 domain-containing protein [Streptomyces cylindrosporus]|uniref:DUF3500 domain-containing protein n=1 Tax=Streptomyces cylindrosporus TaxID=2927583 RepID=A0ABS9YD88_9ACTN|nr:DUF3500 domain-containing protein [Streptomyces cylindrosporus]MCI3274919.1 DUF3500 domain-containing protein [Streptomyces cylindrosporus]
MPENSTRSRLAQSWKRTGVAVTAATAFLVGGAYVHANAATPQSASAGASATVSDATVSDVVTAANTFLNTLSTSQKSKVLLSFTKANATAWSNLPCGSTCRVGIQFSTLSSTQLAAAKAVVQAATGTGSGTGYDQVSKILAADDVLGQSASGYGSGNYYLAFLGTPSTSGTWQLHFGGHHLAVNLTYKNGAVEGTTPYFVGVEPTSWTSGGTTYAPLSGMRNAMLAMLGGLSSSQLAQAKLSTSYSDVLLGPGKDGQFPTTKQGLAVSGLSSTQQALVLAAITPWVKVADDTTSASLLSTYQSELSGTYISYSGSSALSSQGDYVRIDGPGVWIEFVCQNGVVYSGVHYHTVYRDHTRDYGGEFSF